MMENINITIITKILYKKVYYYKIDKNKINYL